MPMGSSILSWFRGAAPGAGPRRQPPLDVTGVDFLGRAFPERAFPPVAGGAAAFLAACRRGYAAMAAARVAITGLARNVADVLPLSIGRVEDLGGLFADYRVIVYENDSTDDTRGQLERWARANRRVHVVSEDLHDPVNPTTRCLARAERMAHYRRRCQELVLARCGQFDATIIIDLDILGGWSLDGIASTFGSRDWDFVGANGLVFRRHGLEPNHVRQYDTWALRFDADLTPLPTASAGGIVFGRGEPLVPVTSCFGGVGVYTMDAFRAGRYATDDLEHATFHRAMIAGGFPRLWLNPSQIVVYGRRHRFGDGLAGAVLDAAAWVTGRRRPTLFSPDARPRLDETAAPRRAAA
jgi:hypothetical protein